MQITLFGFLWGGVILWAFFQSDFKKMLFVTCLSMIIQCNNVLVLNGTGIGPQAFTVLVACIRLLLVTSTTTIAEKPKYLCVFLILLLGVLMMSMVVNSAFKKKQLIPLVIIIVYTLFFVLLYEKKIAIDGKWLEKLEDTIVLIILIVGLLQVLTKMWSLPLSFILRPLVYNDVTNSDVIFNYKSTSRFYATFMEPSYCGAFLVGLFALISLRPKAEKKNILLSIFIAVAIILTESSTAYGGLAIMIVILLFVRAKKKVYKIILPILLVAGIVFIGFNSDILNEVIFDKADSGSYKVRQQWNKTAISAFENNLLFGRGFRTLRASSLWYSMLGETGLTGAIAYILVVLYYATYIFNGKKYVNATSRALLVLGIVIGQLIACPDLTLSPFWLAQYWFVLAFQIDNEKALYKDRIQGGYVG